MAVQSPLVLVVDDREDTRLLLREFLHLEGYSIVEASDADGAVELALTEKPSVILMDIMMPGRDGLSAIQEIRGSDALVGIIVLTAFSTEQYAIRALQVGADDYMHKPFEMPELRARVEAVLDRCRLRQENRRLQDRLNAILEHYMPAPVAQRLIDAPDMPSLGGERQMITVLFADLRGFTGFTALTPPEELIQRLNAYLSVAAETILEHKGTVDKFLGDGVMAMFNAPLPDRDHLVNAIRAATQIHERVEQMCAESDHPIKLQFGIGIHTGEAIVGNIGTASLMNYTAVGDSVNMTKRLEERARPGQTIISQAVLGLLGDRLEVKSLEPLKIKGMAEPEPIFELQRLRS
jgi:adenylate cyclase